MSRMKMVYDGKVADDLTKDEIIEAILREYKIVLEEKIIKAMTEAYRCGFLRGEDYGRKE